MAEQCKVSYRTIIVQGIQHQQFDRKCERDAVRDGLCHFHLDDTSKDLAPIIEEIKVICAQPADEKFPYADFSHFVFPSEPFTFPVAARRPMLFEHSKFYGDVSFTGQKFPSYVSFHGANFLGNADFGPSNGNPYGRQVRFSDTVRFSSVNFRGKAAFPYCEFAAAPVFNGAVFHGVTSFDLADLQYGGPEDLLEFRTVDFLGNSTLNMRCSGKLKGIQFAYCDLSGLVVSSLPFKKLAIEFEAIKEWHRVKSFARPWRIAIRDESYEGPPPVKIIETYGFLEKYFYEHSDYGLSSQFHIGKMIALRKDKYFGHTSRLLNHLYQAASNYGSSLLRPVVALIITWLLIPAFLLLLGMPVDRAAQGFKTPYLANWDVTWDLGGTDWTQYWNDYCSAFGSNLSLSTVDRKHEYSPPSDSIQKVVILGETVLNVTLGALLVIAARRKFTPKEPAGE